MNILLILCALLVIGSAENATEEVNLLEETTIEPVLSTDPTVPTTTSEPMVSCITSTPPITEFHIENNIEKMENEEETAAAPKTFMGRTKDRAVQMARDAYRFAKVVGEKSSKAAADTYDTIGDQFRKL